MTERIAFQRELGYTVTNESIDAVLAGFGVQLEGHPRKILAVGGSGDISFALLPFVDELDVVDINPAQIEFIKERVEQLKAGNFNAFLNPDIHGFNDSYGSPLYQSYVTSREQYFQQDKRLEMVQDSLDKMTLKEPCNVFSYLRHYQKNYSGIYLSNVMTTVHDFTSQRELLKITHERLEPNGIGLLYLSDGDVSYMFPKDLQKDEELTSASRKFGRKIPGLPSVYRNLKDT